MVKWSMECCTGASVATSCSAQSCQGRVSTWRQGVHWRLLHAERFWISTLCARASLRHSKTVQEQRLAQGFMVCIFHDGGCMFVHALAPAVSAGCAHSNAALCMLMRCIPAVQCLQGSSGQMTSLRCGAWSARHVGSGRCGSLCILFGWLSGTVLL